MPLPLFGSKKFTPKKAAVRSSTSLSSQHQQLDRSEQEAEFGLELGKLNMRLGDVNTVFANGHWLTEGGGKFGVGSSTREAKLRKQNKSLEEENNLLKVKVELLLDMLTQTTAESHLMKNELEEIKTLTKPHRKS